MLILGAIVAGGRATRFGADKALAQWRGRALIAHAADALRPWVNELAVCGREWSGLQSIADLPAPGLGPLGGLAGALSYAVGSGFDAVLTIACDTLDVPGDLFERLTHHAPSFCVDAPVLGYWPATLAPTLRDRLARGEERSLRGWARAVGAVPVAAGTPLRNVNTPADLATA